jgi:phage repressor protein C with HTH and peptisase S24 domain
LPLAGSAQVGNPNTGKFDDAGIPVGKSWGELAFPALDDENAYAIQVAGNSLAGAYRDGTVLIVSPNASVRRGDRIVVKTKDGTVTISELKRRTSKLVELRSIEPEPSDRTLALRDVLWMQRIIWASQ